MDGTIVLEAHICDQRRSYTVAFDGPNAEDMALAFMAKRSSTHMISEKIIWEERWHCAAHGGDEFYREDAPAEDQPYRIDGNQYPRLYEALYPACHHGLSESLCMDPFGDNHFGTREQEIANGW